MQDMCSNRQFNSCEIGSRTDWWVAIDQYDVSSDVCNQARIAACRGSTGGTKTSVCAMLPQDFRMAVYAISSSRLWQKGS
jgi:hypothetical protein